MGKWGMVRLGDVCEKKISTLPVGFTDEIVYIDISSIDNGLKEIVSYQEINGKEAPSRAKQILEENDIIVSTVRPNLNAVAINTVNSRNIVVASTGYCVLRCKKAVDIRYVFQFCQSKRFISALIKVAKGASYPAASNNDVKSAEIPLPPLDEQKRIAKNLDLASEIVKGYKEQLAELDKLVQSVFYEMFGDIKSNNMKWEIRPFAYCTIIDTKMTTDFTRYAEYPHIGIDCIEKNTGNIVSYSLVKSSGLKSGKYLFDARHLIYSKIRPNLNKVAKPDFEGVCSADAYPLLPTEHCNREYLVMVLRSGFFLDYILAFSNRTNIPKVNKSQLESFSLPLPPLPLQTRFAAIVTDIEAQKAQVQMALLQAQNLFNSLMQEYFE